MLPRCLHVGSYQRTLISEIPLVFAHRRRHPLVKLRNTSCIWRMRRRKLSRHGLQDKCLYGQLLFRAVSCEVVRAKCLRRGWRVKSRRQWGDIRAESQPWLEQSHRRKDVHQRAWPDYELPPTPTPLPIHLCPSRIWRIHLKQIHGCLARWRHLLDPSRQLWNVSQVFHQ